MNGQPVARACAAQCAEAKVRQPPGAGSAVARVPGAGIELARGIAQCAGSIPSRIPRGQRGVRARVRSAPTGSCARGRRGRERTAGSARGEALRARRCQEVNAVRRTQQRPACAVALRLEAEQQQIRAEREERSAREVPCPTCRVHWKTGSGTPARISLAVSVNGSATRDESDSWPLTPAEYRAQTN